MKCRYYILIIVLFSLSEVSSQYYPLRKIEEKMIQSHILDEKRSILISKPNGYNSSKEKYFVVYVLDGNVNTHFTAGIAELLYQAGYPRLLIVGIPSSYRSRDLTPTAVENTPTGGGADNFMSFLEKELKPYIKNNYRAHDYSVLVGHSFGGLFASHVLDKKPDLFDAYVAITPTVVYDNSLLISRLTNKFKKETALKKTFFFSVGKEPGDEGDAVFHLHEKVFKKFAPKNLDWKFEYYPKENHSTTPLIATLDGLRFVFKDLVPNDSLVAKKGFKNTVSYYKNLSEKYHKNIKIPQRVLMNYGYSLLDSKDQKEAFKVFEYYVEKYPNIPVGYDGLAILYEKKGHISKAIKNLEKLLEIDPVYEDAKLRLKRLKLKK